MKIVFNNFIPFRGFIAINLFGVLFARHGAKIDDRTISHELIHSAQMSDCRWIGIITLMFSFLTGDLLTDFLLLIFAIAPFYWLYLLEWLIKLPFYGRRAYRNISFEREAYSHEHYYEYTKKRKSFSFVKYILP